MYLVFEYNTDSNKGAVFLGAYQNIPVREPEDAPISVYEYQDRAEIGVLRLAAAFRINLDKLTING